MEYKIKFRHNGVIGVYYMPLVAEQEIIEKDILYSARMTVAKLLGTNQFEIISVHKCI